MRQFTIGQRWVSAGELHLGIGLVIEVDFRTVSIVYPASGETRVYMKQSAPLSRVLFDVGDRISDHDGREMVVEKVLEQAGLVTYQCTDEQGQAVRLGEGKLNNFIRLNQPLQRLLNGQVDHNKWFELRARSQKILSVLAQSTLQGLTGCRTSLIDHQLYIAHEVARRYAPRVLLADEVGLGKTIEAGLIIHQQLLNERVQRVLILVPESLLHQWLVEMLRRFNLLFSVFDEERCDAIDGAHDDDQFSLRENPFFSEQLVLCSLEFLSANPQRFQQSLQGDWDMLVVDEAHHLVWQADEPSIEYQLVEQLAHSIESVLLLTATPEQLGKESHFARLRLLDPDRFSDLNHFIDDEQHYRPVADIVEALTEDRDLNDEQMALLQQTVSEGDNEFQIEHIHDPDESIALQAREQLVEHLLDRHGTGRVLFRNTRHVVQGFPERQLHGYPLENPAEYRDLYDGLDPRDDINPQWLLSPEILLDAVTEYPGGWTDFDPRIDWLVDFLKSHAADKVLVICSSAKTAMTLVRQVKQRSGRQLAAFHEQLTLLERDRAAAWFADQETGTQALICSEIGSEGRNFQFAHHLVMFDLPYNPDLLEQRIGRLDRIGQSSRISIHVPYLEQTPQQVMLEWLHRGLNAFEHTCPAGHNVFMQTRQRLLPSLYRCNEDHSEFYQHTARLHAELQQQMQNGRDRLLEYNSCRPAQAARLREQAQSLNQQLDLPHFMEALYDCYGIGFEIHSAGCWVLQPTDNMLAKIPGLPDDGMTVTYDRDIALANEDVRFLTWEHPFVRGLMDLLQGSEMGNTSLIAIKYPQVSPGTLLIDCFFRVDISSTAGSGAQRYLPDNLLRVCIDEQGQQHQQVLGPDYIQRNLQLVDLDTAFKVIHSRADLIKTLLDSAQSGAEDQLPQILEQARVAARDLLEKEAERLVALQTINPNVRDDEIEFFQQQLAETLEQIDRANIRLDAIRVLVAI